MERIKFLWLDGAADKSFIGITFYAEVLCKDRVRGFLPGVIRLFIDGVERKVVLQTSQGNFDSEIAAAGWIERDIRGCYFVV